MDQFDITIRAARPEEGPELTELALRAKSHWGYDSHFLDSARADLVIDAGTIGSGRIHVLERDGDTIGFYGIVGDPPQGRLEWMFLEPDVIGTGYGGLMWDHAITDASAAGFAELLIESDRFAERFYLAMGAIRVGSTPSPVDGAPLPLLEIDLAAATG
jgi:GNAT superfamily N-acetyltransferase